MIVYQWLLLLLLVADHPVTSLLSPGPIYPYIYPHIYPHSYPYRHTSNRPQRLLLLALSDFPHSDIPLRTDREGGRRLRQQLISLPCELDLSASALALTRTLLYSGLPDQVIDLYCDIVDRVVNKSSLLVNGSSVFLDAAQLPVLMDVVLLPLAASALIRGGRVVEAGALLRAGSRAGLELGGARRSRMVGEMAEASARGLDEALLMRSDMGEAGEAMSPAAYAAVLRGLWMRRVEHGSPTMSLEGAQRLTITLLRDFLAEHNCTRVPKRVGVEGVRGVFRAAAARVGGEGRGDGRTNGDMEEDATAAAVKRTDNGLIAAQALMRRFGIGWDADVAAAMMAECLAVGGSESSLPGVLFVVRQMRRRRVPVRTACFNALLGETAAAGRAEVAVRVLEIMQLSPYTRPDNESYALALQACVGSERGALLGAGVAKSMAEGGCMDRGGWHALMRYTVAIGGSWSAVAAAMSRAGVNADESTVEVLATALLDAGRGGSEAMGVFESMMAIKDQLLPAPSPDSLIMLLELMKDSHLDAVAALESVCAAASSVNDNGPGARFRRSLLTPSADAFAVAMEAAVEASDADSAFAVFRLLEQLGVDPSTRVFASLIRAFGLRGDVYSCIGVFEDVLLRWGADDQSLDALLQSALRNPSDVRLAVPVMETLSTAGFDLDAYSKDVIMQSFDDARQLGKVLSRMQTQELPRGCERVSASFGVLSALVQAARRGGGAAAVVRAMLLIGAAGVAPDNRTMEYFDMPDVPEMNSVGSSWHNRKLVPNQRKKVSALDIEVPLAYRVDLSARRTYPSRLKLSPPKLSVEWGDNPWRIHLQALESAMAHNLVVPSVFDEKGELVAEDFNSAFREKSSEETSNADESTDVTVRAERKGKRRRAKGPPQPPRTAPLNEVKRGPRKNAKV